MQYLIMAVLVDPYLIEKIQDNMGNGIYCEPKIACITCHDIPVIYGETEKLDGFKENTSISDNANALDLGRGSQ